MKHFHFLVKNFDNARVIHASYTAALLCSVGVAVGVAVGVSTLEEVLAGVLDLLSLSHQLMTRATHPVGPLRGLPWQRGVVTGADIT